MKITESQLRRIIREAILAEHNKDQIPIHDAPVTFEFVEEDHGVGMEGFAVSASHLGTGRVGFITAIPYWDELTQRGMRLPERTMKDHKNVEIYTVDIAKLGKIFKGEGLGTQMYKFLIANLSKRNIALVPGEWTRHSDRKSKNSLAVQMMNNTAEQLPVGERGTSHDALRVWRKFDIPAFYPEWNPDDYKTFQSTRKRGWEDRTKSKRNSSSIEEALIKEAINETHDQVICRMLDMDPWTFDQNKEIGYQSLSTPELQIDALRAYVNGPIALKNLKEIPEGEFHDPETIIWHLGQALAIRGDPGDKHEAIKWMTNAVNVTTDPQTKRYYNATIAFLEDNKAAFKKYASGENYNSVTLKRLCSGWGKSYSQAYNLDAGAT